MIHRSMPRGKKSADSRPTYSKAQAYSGAATTTKGKKGRQSKGKGKKSDQFYNLYEIEQNDSDDGNRAGEGGEVGGLSEYQVDHIDSEDDEEIDSDDAFDVSDDEHFANLDFSKNKNKNQKGSSKKLNKSDDDDEDDSENIEDEEEENLEGMVDISEMLTDINEEKKTKVGEDKKQTIGFKDLANIDDNDDDDDSDNYQEESSGTDGDMGSDKDDSSKYGESDSEMDEIEDDGDDGNSDDDEKVEKLGSFISSLGTKRKKYLDETNELVAESEFNIKQRSRTSNKVMKLSLGDLMGSLEDGNEVDTGAGRQNLLAAKKAVDSIQNSLLAGSNKKSSSVVQAPLPKRLQDQLERQEAYTQTKASVSEWEPIVYKNREAAHLSFETEDQIVEPETITKEALIDEFQKPSNANDFEQQIQGILKESGMTSEANLNQYEELELKKLSPEEARERRKELQVMRELMFRQERKSKRMKKIKSKAYRRILKKQKLKQQEEHFNQMLDDGTLDEEELKEQQLKIARKRAEERMTLRHKNTGKWAKQMIKYGKNDPDAQKALQEQLDQHNEAMLKRKIHDLDSDEELSDLENQDASRVQHRGASGDSSEDEREKAIREINDINNSDGEQDAASYEGKGKGLFAMKFMQNAMKAQKEQRLQEAEELKLQLAEEAEDQADEDIDTGKPKKNKNKANNSTTVSGNPGRMVFNSAGKSQVSSTTVDANNKKIRLNEAGKLENSVGKKGHTVKLTGNIETKPGYNKPSSKKGQNSKQTQDDNGDGDSTNNPWLDSKAAKKLAKIDRPQKPQKQSENGNKASGKGGKVILDTNKTLLDINNNDAPTQDEDVVAMYNEESAISNAVSKNKSKTTSSVVMAQRDLVERAFANDDVVEKEFEQERAQLIEDQTPKDEDLTLPGWGSWGGAGIQKPKNKIIRKAPTVSKKLATARKEFQKYNSNVIVNEKILKANTKYQVENIPHPFGNAQEYEYSMQVPIGKEWNTTGSFNRLIKPRVITKMGKIIKPISAPFKKDQ
ncbi:hypothetical protein H4219_004882 [Mycoemilia scoparia]|uniref:U3 small nucleolar RNA-associated protein 14 n=1 Tax=Mycoemilia scoparia TaxID=417184 RepID=A0A9W7ZZP9_9FUNG|nr:hypothetical protein H4219_004882 [Mycoemilia scoparia]